MEQKIRLEIRLRELAAQSMLEARNEIDVLEVEKSLLTSDQRMICYGRQLEQQRKQLSKQPLQSADNTGRGFKSWSNWCSDIIGHTVRSSSGDSNGDGRASNGATSSGETSSPTKLSPSSGESANNSTKFSSNSSHHSRSGAHRYSTNTLKRRAKDKKRDQLIQSITNSSNINCNMVTTNRASVSISELRIPLMWRDVDHFKGRGDYKRFAIFCLLKIDSQIYDTQLISDVDRQVTDVTFDDVVVFNEIDHNFELVLEVYSCVYLEQFSLSSTPRKLKERLSSSLGRAMGKRLTSRMVSSNYTKELQAYDKSYRFAMIASASLKLEDASDSVKTYDLVLTTPSAHYRNHPNDYSLSPKSYATGGGGGGAINRYSYGNSYGKDAQRNTLPLFGHFCCKLFVRPNVFDKTFKAGYLKVAAISLPAETDLSCHNNNSSKTSYGLSSARAGEIQRGSRYSYAGADQSPVAHHNQRLSSAFASSNKMGTLSLSSSVVHWGLLRNFALYLWPVDERWLHSAILAGQPPAPLANLRKPALSLHINKFARLLRVSNSSLTIETDQGCHVLGAYCPEGGVLDQSDEMAHWLRSIEQYIFDSHIWGSVLNHYPSPQRPMVQTSIASGHATNTATTRSSLSSSSVSSSSQVASPPKSTRATNLSNYYHHYYHYYI